MGISYLISFTASLAMDFTYSMFFNTVFTFLTTVSIGIFDQDVNSKVSLLVPQIYMKGIRQEMYSSQRYWLYMGYGIYQSLVCYFGVYLISFDGTFHYNGYDFEAVSAGTTTGFVAILMINIFSTSNWHSWTWITVFSLLVSMFSWILYIGIYSRDPNSPTSGMKILFSTPIFYAAVVLLVILGLLPKMAIRYVQQNIFPSDTDLLLEIQKYIWDGHGLGFMEPQVPKQGTSKSMSESKSLDEMNKKQKIEFTPVIDGFGHTPMKDTAALSPVIAMKKSQSLNPNEIDGEKGRKPSFSGVFKTGMSKIVQTLKGEKPKIHRSGSIVYMGGTGIAIPNTGFAFSHDQGMEDIITPRTAKLEVLEEEPIHEKKKRYSQQSKIRNFSKSIQNVIRSYTRSIHSTQEVDEKAISSSNSHDFLGSQGKLPAHGNANSAPVQGNLLHPALFIPLNTIPSVIEAEGRASDPGHHLIQICIDMEEDPSNPVVIRSDSAPIGIMDASDDIARSPLIETTEPNVPQLSLEPPTPQQTDIEKQ
jgi:glutaredoxin-related protein